MASFFDGKENRSKKINFAESIDCEFETYRFKIPKGYDAILKDLYGDYMKLPPKNEQVTHHSFDAYWKE